MHAQLTGADIKWDERYVFDKCNYFSIEFYASGNELMRTGSFATSYQSAGENFAVRTVADKKGMGIETVIDQKHAVAIQLFGTGGGAVPTYHAGGYRYPDTAELKKLELVSTDETKVNYFAF